MVPKKSRFCPKGPNFAFVASFRAKSQITNPVSERLTIMYDGCQGEVPEAEAPETPWEGGGGREVSKDESLGSLDGQFCV